MSTDRHNDEPADTLADAEEQAEAGLWIVGRDLYDGVPGLMLDKRGD